MEMVSLMRATALVNADHQLDWALGLGCEEVLLPAEGLAREGGFGLDVIEIEIERAKSLGLCPILLADRLVEQSDFESILKRILGISTAMVRVCDLGLAKRLLESGRMVQLALESGHANGEAILAWCRLLPGLDRLILNHQIPRRNLLPMLPQLPVETEILGLGPIAMYYTPRKLLSIQGCGEKNSKIHSDEMGPGQYNLSESDAGTVMYYDKWLCLFPHREELQMAGLNGMRLDLRFLEASELETLAEALKNPEFSLRKAWARPLLHGFYGENKSDSIFPKLVGRRPDMARKVVGEVMDRVNSRLLLFLQGSCSTGDHVGAKDGRGQWHRWTLDEFYSPSGVPVQSAVAGQLVLIKRPRNFAVGTYIYRESAP